MNTLKTLVMQRAELKKPEDLCPITDIETYSSYMDYKAENTRLLPLITQLARQIEKMEGALKFYSDLTHPVHYGLPFKTKEAADALADLEQFKKALQNDSDVESSEARELAGE